MTDTRSEIWDCVVVGAGVIGSWTAYHLTQAGYNTLLIDQFDLPHRRGSSHGGSKLIRTMYFEEHHVELTTECYYMWEKLAGETCRTLIKNTGLILVADKDSSLLQQTKRVAEKYPEASECLNEQDLKRRYPMLRLPPDVNGVIDNTAGLLPADTCLQALWEMIKKRGGTIQDSTQVTDVNPSTEPASLSTNRGIIKAKRIILAPGPWASDILQKVGLNLPIKTIPGCCVYSRDLTSTHSIDAGCPVVYQYIENDEGNLTICVMFPCMEKTGFVKLLSRVEPPADYCHPDERNRCNENPVVQVIQDYVLKHLPGVDSQPSILQPCIYTMTPDKDFIIDQHPKYKNVFIGAGGSGHAFMRSPVIGKLLCEMVQEKDTSYDRKPYLINRFNK